MSGSNNKKRFVFVISLGIILLSFLYFICFSLFQNPLRNIDSEAKTSPFFVVRGSLFTEKEKIPIARICHEEYNLSVNEIFCVNNKRAYFICGGSRWIIASIDLDNHTVIQHYTFDVEEEFYQMNRSIAFEERNGFYYKGTIVLNDFHTVLSYNIQNGTVTKSNFEEYEFPVYSVPGNFVDFQTIEMSVENSSKKHTLSSMGEKSDSIKELNELNKKNTWNKQSYLSNFFSECSIQENEHGIYAVGSVYNYSGESYAVVLEYKDGLWLYNTDYFSGDAVHRNCYVID